MANTITEPTQNIGGDTCRTNEDVLNGALNQLKNASTEILKAGAAMYPILGIGEPTAGVYDAGMMLKDAINTLERALNTE